MAPNIGESIKSAVERVAEAVEHIIAKVAGHSHDKNNAVDHVDATPAPEPMVVATDAVSEPLEFERTDTDGTKKTLTFEPASDTPASDTPGTVE